MAVLVFRLNGVSEQEADEVRDLLTTEGFEFYETSAGRWRISVAAIWLVNDDDYTAARERIDEYQKQRQIEQRAAVRQAMEEGRAPSWKDRWRDEPATLILVWVGLAVVVAISIWPFFNWIRS
ncbi:DUF6164 family protein [Saccharospirillum impatiens]|uniref:DUF6164 family protein n=1 Tax=Saccharospirillum impatiens TaxID=169438 RepID=UPI000427CD90|nr:DUF6164 family protein [Saccharospirillum impatiens]